MTRAGGVSEMLSTTATGNARGAKHRKGESDGHVASLGARLVSREDNAAAGWFAGRSPADGTARPANAEGTRTTRNLTRGGPSDLSAENDRWAVSGRGPGD